MDPKQFGTTITTGIGFFDHMLEQIAKHGAFGLEIACDGDLEVDEHHTVEDVAICLGTAMREALGNKHGIGRYVEMVRRTVNGADREYLVIEYAPSKRNQPGDRQAVVAMGYDFSARH